MRWDESARRSVDALYRRHLPEAIRLAVLLVGDRARAEDVAQDAFIAVASRLISGREPDNFAAYLRRAVVNRVLQDERSGSRARRREQLAAATAGTTPWGHEDVDVAGGVSDRRDLAVALAALPARQRSALVLRYFCDLDEATVADLLGCRPGTVKSLTSRALAALRERSDLDGHLR